MLSRDEIVAEKYQRLPAFYRNLAAVTGVLWKNSGGCRVFRSKFPPLVDLLMLILFLFQICFRDVYYVPGPNPKTIPLSRSRKRKEVEFRKILRVKLL